MMRTGPTLHSCQEFAIRSAAIRIFCHIQPTFQAKVTATTPPRTLTAPIGSASMQLAARRMNQLREIQRSEGQRFSIAPANRAPHMTGTLGKYDHSLLIV